MRSWLVIGVLALALSLGGSIGGAYALSLWQIHRSQEVWCPTLALIRQHPPPAGSSSADVALYRRLVALRVRFGCP